MQDVFVLGAAPIGRAPALLYVQCTGQLSVCIIVWPALGPAIALCVFKLLFVHFVVSALYAIDAHYSDP